MHSALKDMDYGMKFFCVFIIGMKGMAQPFHHQSENAYITAGAYSMHFTDAFSFASNPACLGTMEGFSGGIMAERKWMLKELDNYTLAASCMFGKGGLGISLQYSGDADYSEKVMELAYGKNLGRVEMGIRLAIRGLKLPVIQVLVLVPREWVCVFMFLKN